MKSYEPMRLFCQVQLGETAATVLERYQKQQGATKQRMFDLFLALVFQSGTSPSFDLSKGASKAKTSLVLQNPIHAKMFAVIQDRYNLGVWETVRYIIIEGARILESDPLLKQEGVYDLLHTQETTEGARTP